MSNVVRFRHFRTWTGDVARPACLPEKNGPKRAKSMTTTSDRSKVTCPHCNARLTGEEPAYHVEQVTVQRV